MTMTPQRLGQILDRLPATQRYLVAYSGGRDSHVLLHMLATLFDASSAARLSAVHVNHGLQPDADNWMAHCSAVCRRYAIPCHTLQLKMSPNKGESLEAQARKARYQALAGLMDIGDILLTAHHQQDQAETVLLQLLRGAGPTGLSAMPELTEFGCGYMARPLLNTNPSDIEQYAERAELHWIEDPSNKSPQFDRNFLRNQVIPLLQGRWPALSRTLSRSARYCAESQQLIDTLAAADLAHLSDPQDHTLALSGLSLLPPPRARAVLRAWIRSQGFPVPGSVRLERVLNEMVTAVADKNPLVHWPGAEVRRFRDRLHIMQPLALLADDLSLEWNGETALQLPAGIGRLETEMGPGGLCLTDWRAARIEIRFGRRHRQGVRIAGRAHTTTFKKLFQQYAVPVWSRSRIPLVYLNGELAAVGDLCICEPFAAARPEQGIHIRWLRPSQANS